MSRIPTVNNDWFASSTHRPSPSSGTCRSSQRPTPSTGNGRTTFASAVAGCEGEPRHPTPVQSLPNSNLRPSPRPRRFETLSLNGAVERLEPDDGKLSRPVLRGGDSGNAIPLPGARNCLCRGCDPQVCEQGLHDDPEPLVVAIGGRPGRRLTPQAWTANAGQDGDDNLVAQGEEGSDGPRPGRRHSIAARPAGFFDQAFAAQLAEVVGSLAD